MKVFALTYAGAGWPVLPLKPGDKQPLTKNGVKDADTDLIVVDAWWNVWPNANVGLATGHAFDVLDIDTMPEDMGELPPGPVSTTGKGRHHFFAPTGAGNRAGLLPGVDWRGAGGYVVAPPSVHPSGGLYLWAEAPTLALPVAPEWLLTLLRPAPLPPAPSAVDLARLGSYASQALQGEYQKVLDAIEGTRNSTLNDAAYRLGQLVGAGVLETSAAVNHLFDAATRIGLPEKEAENTIVSGIRSGMANPRTIETKAS